MEGGEVGGIAQCRWGEVEAGVMCKWNLHRGGEVEAMRTRWYGGGSEEELVEHAGRRRVYTIGISPAACGSDTNNRRHIIRAVITGKESITRDMRHRERGKGTRGSEGEWRRERSRREGVGATGGSGDRRNKEEKRKKGRYYRSWGSSFWTST